MLDLENIEKYRENNRIEAKKATGGLPVSLWETYSAFANTLGGVILLGVEEYSDKSLHPVDLTETEWMLKDFWEIINDPRRVSINILGSEDVQVREIEGKRIIVINVPRAERDEKPVYINGDPVSGSYRRNGEGDYRCTYDEVQAMLRDSLARTPDMAVLTEMDQSVFDSGSIRSYRSRLRAVSPDHGLCALENQDFLLKLGATGRDSSGRIHPTAAGLLIFGREHEILREFPAYFLEYREKSESGEDISIVSSSGDWSGNLYDFFVKVSDRLEKDIFVPSGQSGGDSVRAALKEALANCLVNADYYGKEGLAVVRDRDGISFSNPGGFRMGIDAARREGVSDPRNTSLVRMFSLIGAGGSGGKGLSTIFRAWDSQGWSTPVIKEEFAPDRITLSLSIGQEAHNSSKSPLELRREAVIDYLTYCVSADDAELSELLGIGIKETEKLTAQLAAEGIIVADETGKGAGYRLKS